MLKMDANDKEVLLDTLCECRLIVNTVKIKSGRHAGAFETLQDLVRALDLAADDLTGERRYLVRMQ